MKRILYIFFAIFYAFNLAFGVSCILNAEGLAFREMGFKTFSSEPAEEISLELNKTSEPTQDYKHRVIRRSVVPVTGGLKNNTVNIDGKNYSVTAVATTSVDAGRNVNIFRKMLYGHSTLAFSKLRYFQPGATFRLNLNGETATYRVEARRVYLRDNLNDNSSLRGSVYRAQLDGRQYDISLMTCGDGGANSNDENYRLVLFANKI